ncbi:hypothetical protein BLS_002861 [Venturia inaequalis]|uniref:Uncharacterized protein n=1 Tax=Venturia inaequalis TaxID=5025 RepID=A0A8H3U659_VENIN|nr:hypothetical protein EG328_010335 [Venturia inaequalis]KAE9974911.1 hypothetical protein BLS_002861 [Venturia inaequalis]
MADFNPWNNTFERSTNGAANANNQGQQGNRGTNNTSQAEQQDQNDPVVENRPLTVAQQQQRHLDQHRRAQAEEARSMGGMYGGMGHQNDAPHSHAPNGGFQLRTNQYHGQIADTPQPGDENSDRFSDSRQSARAGRTRNDMGYNAALPPSFPGPVQHNQGAPSHTQGGRTPAPGNTQVAPVAQMLAVVPMQPQGELVEVPPLQITDPRWIIDQERRITIQDPRFLADWVHAEQTAIAQDQLVANTNRMLAQEVAANGGQVPAYLLPFLPPMIETEPPSTHVPMPTNSGPMLRSNTFHTPQDVHDYLIAFSTRWWGHFEQTLGPGPDGLNLSREEAGWTSYTPNSSEVATWRAFLIGGTQRPDGGMWTRTTLRYITVTALDRLEVYGFTVDPLLGPYDTREALDYALNYVLQACQHDQEIQQLGRQVQVLLRNATPRGPPAFPTLGLQLVSDHIRRVRGGAMGELRPPVPSFPVAGNGAFGPGASMLPPGPGSRTGRSTAPSAGLDWGHSAPTPSSAFTESTAFGLPNNAGVGSAQSPVHRRLGRPRGSTSRNRAGTRRGSTTGGSTTMPLTPAGPASLSYGQMPTSFFNNQTGAPSMLQSTNTGEAPGVAGNRPRRRLSQVNHDTAVISVRCVARLELTRRTALDSWDVAKNADILSLTIGGIAQQDESGDAFISPKSLISKAVLPI